MASLTPREEQRRSQRVERLRRDRMRRRRQGVALVLALVVLVVVGTAFALRPSAGASTTGVSGTPTAQGATGTVGTTAGPEPEFDASAPAVTETTEPATPATTTTSAAPTHTPAAIKPLKPAPGVKTIVVDKSSQRVTLYKANGTGVDTFRCASGIVYPRIGTYKVYGHRAQSFSMYDDTTFFYFTMFVKSDKGNNIGFHSIPQHPDGKLEGGLGKPVSHGCVRLAKAKAKFLYNWAPVGTKVVIKR